MSTKSEAVEARGGPVLQMETAHLDTFKKERGSGSREYFWKLGDLLENATLLMIASGERDRKEMENLALWCLLSMEDEKEMIWKDEQDTLVQVRTAFLDEAATRGFYKDDEIVQTLEPSRDGLTYLVSLIRFKALFNFFTASKGNLATRRNALRFLLGANVSTAHASWEPMFWGGVLFSLKSRQSFGS